MDLATPSPTALPLDEPRFFGEVRRAALERWILGQLDDAGERWECRWQQAVTDMPHGCTRPCPGAHVSLFCSFLARTEHFDDLLGDARLDHLVMAQADVILPIPDGFDPETQGLRRWYERLLGTVEVILDDADALYQQARPDLTSSQRRRAELGRGAPLDIARLSAFVNHVAKHGAKWVPSVHRWDHHGPVHFEDSGPAVLAGLGPDRMTAHRSPDRNVQYRGLVMPTLVDLVEVVVMALRNLDPVMADPEVLGRLVAGYGRCLDEI